MPEVNAQDAYALYTLIGQRNPKGLGMAALRQFSELECQLLDVGWWYGAMANGSAGNVSILERLFAILWHGGLYYRPRTEDRRTSRRTRRAVAVTPASIWLEAVSATAISSPAVGCRKTDVTGISPSAIPSRPEDSPVAFWSRRRVRPRSIQRTGSS